MKVHKIKTELKFILISLILGLFISSFFALKTYSNQQVENISSKILRFRVLSNSDTYEDQALKMIVKESVLNKFEKEINSFENREDAIETFNYLLPDIEKYAQSIIYSYGFNYKATAKIDLSEFPTRNYGNVSLPKGEYTTLIIEIGEAQGPNWWCVMFPPLCFVDETMEYVPKEIDNELKNILDKEEYSLVTNETKNDFKYDVKFKIVEIFN